MKYFIFFSVLTLACSSPMGVSEHATEQYVVSYTGESFGGEISIAFYNPETGVVQNTYVAGADVWYAADMEAQSGDSLWVMVTGEGVTASIIVDTIPAVESDRADSVFVEYVLP